ncbi:MAG: BTAD domain-containing putative transcriptional regulator [Erysipelotrichaceae bacterium]|nr:BTAD domain-containing putative transcriptional regulator [Erysipelotrichaceae bacterium]
MKKDVIYISLFGGFTITYKGVTIDVQEHLGKKLVNLFEVLVMNHGKEVSSSSLIDMFWEDSDDPRNSLKFSIFRLRKALDEIDILKGLNLIKTSEDGYMLENEYDYSIDTETFENYYKQIKNISEFDVKEYKTGLKIVSLYKGRLFCNHRSALVTTIESERLSSEFANTIVMMSVYLLKKEKYEDMMRLNHSAIVIEPFYEGLHYYYIKGLIETKDYHRALQYYDEINERFYNELGTGLSPQFKSLYNVINQEEKEEEKKDIDNVKEEIEESIDNTGGFYCTYDMFKYIYELTLKNAKREGKNCYLLLLSLAGDTSVEERVTMSNRAKDIITESIRSNDVFTRINNNQFVTLLVCKGELDDVYIVAQRITSRFYKKYSPKKYRMNYSAKKVS